ncbi:hypothetical protein F5883DRAFT_160295 [Diaporthe sp. PMI_573]|nr:hypothetical protein F5883DRAFT_160295 [Diaporthaceae sp. PMI_573]
MQNRLISTTERGVVGAIVSSFTAPFSGYGSPASRRCPVQFLGLGIFCSPFFPFFVPLFCPPFPPPSLFPPLCISLPLSMPNSLLFLFTILYEYAGCGIRVCLF